MMSVRFIKQVNLRNNVTLAGWQNNVSDFYQTHDIFALSSIYESFGLIFSGKLGIIIYLQLLQM